jgi:hypothetical protein
MVLATTIEQRALVSQVEGLVGDQVHLLAGHPR